MSYGSKTVTTSATLIVEANCQRHSILIHNVGAETVYIGPDAAVTASTGIPLLPSSTWTSDNSGSRLYTGPFYAITESSTADVRYWERTDFR